MKFSQILLISSIISMVACAGVKTRKQAAEEAKNKPPTEHASAQAGPIDEDDDAPVSGVQTPIDDPVLDDELAAMGIDPGTSKAQTPEPDAPPVKAPKAAAKKKKPVKKK